MDFDLNDEERELRDLARRFLDREAPISYARAMMDDARGYRDDVWKQMAELGWTALPFAEAHGGLGMGFIPLSILFTEMGRVVMPGPFFSTILAGLAIAEAGTPEQQARWLPRIASGDLIATLAHHGTVIERGGSVHGTHRFVSDGHIAELVVVVAQSADGGAGLFVADPSDRTALGAMDQTRKVADLRFDGAPAERLGTADARAVDRLVDRAAALLAAEMLGCAERVVELSVDYAKERLQFGRPIGSFQAIKHRAADMLVDSEGIRNAVTYAAWALERDTEDAPLAASMAKAFAGDAALRVAKGGIQIHGGIGFTWEHDMHLFFKRVRADEASFGDSSHHRERVAGLIGTRA